MTSQSAADGRMLPNGVCVDTALWLRVRARLLDTLDTLWPEVTDGNLADVTDAACVGFVEQAREFTAEFSRWYASQVILHMKDAEAAAVVSEKEKP